MPVVRSLPGLTGFGCLDISARVVQSGAYVCVVPEAWLVCRFVPPGF